ncbi:MAG: glycosyltransferase family 4 protein [Mangrovibacterium sp.]
MKIAYIYPALHTVGGANRIITEKANYFADQLEYEVYIITAYQNNRPLFFPLSEKVRHIDLDVNFEKQYRHSFFVRGLIYFRLLHLYKKRLSTLLQSLEVDFTITTISRDIDFLYTLNDGSKKIAEAHVSKEYLRSLHLLKTKGLLYRIVHKIWTYKLEHAIKKFDSFVVLTENDAKNWNKIKKANVIPNSVSFYPEKGCSNTNKKIISVGRLDLQKGYDLLIDAWQQVSKKYPDWTIYVYGNGTEYERLSQMIDSKNLQDSFFIEKPVTNIVEKYIEGSFYVMSSRFEGFGLVLVEAMACGLPVISFDCPDGPADIIKDGENGFLVENGNIEKLAERINFLIEHKGIRKRMGQKAREDVKRYLPNIVMQKWIDLFKSLKN